MKMNKKAPVINYKAAWQQFLIMALAILVGIIISMTTAQAGVRVERNPYNKSLQKKKHTYSCEALMKKHRTSTVAVVKVNTRRPKWR